MTQIVANRYRIESTLDGGGIAAVWQCTDLNLERGVVLKSVKVSGEHKRVFDELSTLQTIRSKHVVEIFDITYFRDGSIGIVQELIEGENLKDEPRPVAEFVNLVYQISAGLADVHAHNVIHRDIKPANLMRAPDGIVKIIDFNLSRMVNDAQTVGFVGTRGYAAPELQTLGDVTFTKAVDMFAAGATFAALLNGGRPPQVFYEGQQKIEAWLQGSEFEQLCSLALSDPELIALIKACLNRNPSARPTAPELRDRAKRILLRGKHKARFIHKTQTLTLSHDSNEVDITLPGGRMVIGYDGLDFRVLACDGDTFINNDPTQIGKILPASAVLTFGARSRGATREFVTVDLSFPEVVL